MTTNLGPWPGNMYPPIRAHATANITPFTYYDGLSFLEVLEALRAWLRETLIPGLDGIIEIVDGMIQDALEKVEIDLEVMRQELNDALASIELTDTELRAYVDDVLQQVINNSIELQDAVAAGLVADEDSDTRGALNAWVTDITSLVPVEKYPRLTSDVTDDRRIGLALAEAIQRNTGVFFAGKTYEIAEEITLTHSINGFVFRGVPGATILRKPESLTGNINAIGVRPDPGQRISNVTISGFHFDGALKNESEFETVRMRSASGVRGVFDLPAGVNPGVDWPSSRVNSAIRAYGNNNGNESFGRTTNVYVSECSFYGLVGLPVYFNEVRGDAVIRESHFRRCLDAGYIFTDNCVFESNRVEFGMDNGVSMSRGAKYVKCIGNTITDSFFNGIWAGGFEGDGQFAEVVISNNIVEHSGQHGIYLGLNASREIVISGNTIKGTYARYGAGNGEGSSIGIRIDHYRTDEFPRAVSISGNIIFGTDRAGMMLTRCAWVSIVGNTLTSVARNRFPDGPIGDPQSTALSGIIHGGTFESSFRSIIGMNVISKGGANSQYGVYVASTSENSHVMANNVTSGFTVPEGRAT